MVIEHIFDTIQLILNKNRRGSIKVSQLRIAVKAAVTDFYNEELDDYRVTGIIPSSLKPFVKDSSTLTLTSGVVATPNDFTKEIIFKTEYGDEGEFLTPEAFNDRLRSRIVAPTGEFPVAKVQDNKIIVQPDEIEKIILTYFRIPTDFVYATTTDGDGRGYTFNSGASTDTEFGLEYSGNIIKKALTYLGVAVQNKEAAEFGLS